MGISKLGRQVFPGISARLIASFSLIFAAMVFIIGWVYLQGVPFTSHEGRIEEQREETFKGLNLVADRKKEQLLRWIDERRGDTLVTAGNASVASGAVHLRQRVYELTEASEPELWSLLSRDETYLDLAGYLRTIRDAYGYYDTIRIADAQTGIVFVSTDNNTLGADLSTEPFLIKALLTRTVFISDITARSEDQQPALHFSHLVSDGKGGAAGVVVMKVKVGVMMKSILQADPFLGESGEALLVNRNTEILTPLKYPLADGTEAKPLQYKIKALPAKLASHGEEGIIETKDYRGEKVLAAYRYISLSADWGWGMVVKRDYAELSAPIRQEINNALIVGVISVVVLMVLTILIVRSITNPIRSLKATAERITGGDLGARAKITSSDEVGALARAFNQMTESLVKAKAGLEEKVRERTGELEIEVTERVQAEEELEKHRLHLEELVKERTVDLEEANIKLQELDRLKSLFIASMSHELRTPLNSIIGFTGIILQGLSGDITGDQRKQLMMVKSSADHLLSLINDVIDVSKIEAGKVALSIERFDLSALLDEVKSAFTPEAEPKGIILSLETPGGLSIRSDERRTKQVIMNLVSNAAKFTDSGKIEIKAATGDGVVEVSVRDMGIGMAREDLEALFKAFSRIRAEGMAIKEGTGLGLYLSQKIAELLGGGIRAESSLGKGSEFTFTLPFEYKGEA